RRGGRGILGLSASDGAEVFRRRLAAAAIRNDVEGDLLTFVEGAHAGALDGADVHEHVSAAGVRLNEAEAFLVVKPLHSTVAHRAVPYLRCTYRTHPRRRGRSPGSFDFG